MKIPSFTFTSKKIAITAATIVVVMCAGVGVVISGHEDKPAKTQATVHAQNTAKKQDASPTNASGASTDAPSNVSNSGANQVAAYTAPAKAPVAPVASSGSSTSEQTGGRGAGEQTGGTTQPGFQLVLHPEAAYMEPPMPFNPDIQHYDIPFDIVYDNGFVPTNFLPGDCEFLATPVPNSNVLCLVSQKANVLSIQFDDSSAAGHYEVQMYYRINDLAATATVDFDLM